MSRQVRKAKKAVWRHRLLTGTLLALIFAVAVGLAASVGANKNVAFASTGTPTVTTLASCGWPTSSGTARQKTAFNESGILVGFTASTNNNLTYLNTFYTDEWPLTLGDAGATTWHQNTPAQTINSQAAGADDVGIRPDGSTAAEGATIAGDNMTSTDLAGRPQGPALFLTDITANSASKAGDWQNQSDNTTGQTPSYVNGIWQAFDTQTTYLNSAGKAIYNGAGKLGSTTLANGTKVPNNFFVSGPGTGALSPPAGTNPLVTFTRNISTAQNADSYADQVSWNVSTLHVGSGGVQPGHTYRVQMMFHDGDHNGDSAEACANVTIPPKNPAPATQAAVGNGGVLSKDSSGNLSAAVSDALNVSGGTANAAPNTTATTDTSGKITMSLFGPATTGTDEAACRGGSLTTAPVYTTTFAANNGADGNAGPPVDFTSGHEGVYNASTTVGLPGTYTWVVSYSGNVENTSFSTTCLDSAAHGESVTVTKAPSSVVTAPEVKVDENITISLSASATAGLTGSDAVDISLAKQDSAGTQAGCIADTAHPGKFISGGSSTQQGDTLHETVSDGTVDPTTGAITFDLHYPADFGSSAPALSSGQYEWFVSYGGNNQVQGSNDDCTEVFSITLP
jgi:hypothetical protein